MKRLFPVICLSWLVAAHSFASSTTSTQSTDAPDDIESFTVGSGPWGLAFDGANIWVTSYTSPYLVTELRASDGMPLGTFEAGGSTLTAAFDGTYIWVTNSLDNTVSR